MFASQTDRSLKVERNISPEGSHDALGRLDANFAFPFHDLLVGALVRNGSSTLLAGATAFEISSNVQSLGHSVAHSILIDDCTRCTELKRIKF